MTDTLLDQVRSLALALPGVEEKVSHRAPCFYVRKRAICRFHDADFGTDDRVSMWCLSPPGVSEEMANTGPDALDWDEIGAILEEAYRLVAPRRLVAELDHRPERG